MDVCGIAEGFRFMVNVNEAGIFFVYLIRSLGKALPSEKVNGNRQQMSYCRCIYPTDKILGTKSGFSHIKFTQT